MARSSGQTNTLRAAAHGEFVLLLCAALLAVVVVAGGDGVVTYSFPAFDATATDNMAVATNSSVVTPASVVFGSSSFPPLFPELNNSEGFLLLPNTVDFWRAGGPGSGDREASFNSSFTLVAGAAPVSFVVLKDAFPTFNAPGGLRGFANYTMWAGGPEQTNATGSLSFVEVGPVRSYDPATGLNVTVSPRGGSAAAVWVEYRADAHRLSVYVAGAGDPRPTNALVADVPLGVGWHWTTETALVGFFAGAVRDVVGGVRNWELTVDRFPGDGKKGTSWWVVLLAVLGSVVAAAAVVSAAVCYFQRRRRRRQLNMEPNI